MTCPTASPPVRPGRVTRRSSAGPPGHGWPPGRAQVLRISVTGGLSTRWTVSATVQPARRYTRSAVRVVEPGLLDRRVPASLVEGREQAGDVAAPPAIGHDEDAGEPRGEMRPLVEVLPGQGRRADGIPAGRGARMSVVDRPSRDSRRNGPCVSSRLQPWRCHHSRHTQSATVGSRSGRRARVVTVKPSVSVGSGMVGDEYAPGVASMPQPPPGSGASRQRGADPAVQSRYAAAMSPGYLPFAGALELPAFVCDNCGYWQRHFERPPACPMCLDSRHVVPQDGWRFWSRAEAQARFPLPLGGAGAGRLAVLERAGERDRARAPT